MNDTEFGVRSDVELDRLYRSVERMTDRLGVIATVRTHEDVATVRIADTTGIEILRVTGSITEATAECQGLVYGYILGGSATISVGR